MKKIIESLCNEGKLLTYENMDEKIEEFRMVLFSFGYDIPVSNKAQFERKFILHNIFNEIGLETFGRFRVALQSKIIELAPKYKQLYEIAIANYNPVLALGENTKTTTTRSGTGGKNRNEAVTGNSETTTTAENSETGRNIEKFSDTPQNGLSGLLNDDYLTNATMTNNESTGTSEGTATGTSESTSSMTESNFNNTQMTINVNKSKDYAQALKEFN
ncbi:MAG: hypothetical protein KBT46_05610, partial [Ruminococcus sp.]|nr:hypothetical protein [Candidatus Copronaster equi]